MHSLLKYPNLSKNDSITEVEHRIGKEALLYITSPDFTKKKEIAAREAATILCNYILRTQTPSTRDPYESSESGNESDNDDYEYNSDTINNIAEALQYNYVLDAAFHKATFSPSDTDTVTVSNIYSPFDIFH